MGMREPSAGRIFLGDADISDWHTREIREAGVGYIPEDRHRHGLLLEAPLWENRILGHQTEAPNVTGPRSSTPPRAKADTERIVEEYDVRTPVDQRHRRARCPAATSRSSSSAAR